MTDAAFVQEFDTDAGRMTRLANRLLVENARLKANLQEHTIQITAAIRMVNMLGDIIGLPVEEQAFGFVKTCAEVQAELTGGIEIAILVTD